MFRRKMNSSTLQINPDAKYMEIFIRNFVTVAFGITISSINGLFVITFFKSSVFYNDPRYILYIHLVMNDMLMVFLSVTLSVIANITIPAPICLTMIFISLATHKNTPLTLAGMALERYIAICKPLHHSQICTVRRTYILISLIWGVGVIPGLTDMLLLSIIYPLSFFTSNVFCTAVKLFNSPYHEESTKYMSGIYASSVWLILVFTYCQVLVAARKASADKASAKKAQNTIMLHGAQLLLCTLSYLHGAMDQIYFTHLSQNDRSKMIFMNYLFTSLLPRLLTPLIYGVRDKRFFSHIKGLLMCKLFVVKVKSTPNQIQ